MTPVPLTSLKSLGGASEGIKGGVMTVEEERGPGLDFSLCAAVVREGLSLFFCVFYFIIKVIKCLPVPASFFPYLLTVLQ